MEEITEADTNTPSDRRIERRRQVRNKIKGLIPFMAGILAALLGLLIYNLLKPAPEPITLKQVNAAVAEAMASATPAPAYSAQVYQVIQPSLVLIQSSGSDKSG